MTEAEQTQSPLQSDRGATTIASTVVSQIAGMSAQEVEGVHMGGGASRSASGLLQSITGSDSQTRGVSVEVGSVETAIDLTMGIEYGKNMLGTVGEVRQKITERIHNMTGLRITELNVTISDVIFPENGQTRPALQRAETRTGPDFDTRTTPRREPAAGEIGRTEPSEQTRQESEATPVEPRSRTRTEDESGPVPEEEVRAEGEPVGEDETRRLRMEDERAEEAGGTTETGGEGAGDDRTQEIDRERVAEAEERSRRRRERRRRRGEES